MGKLDLKKGNKVIVGIIPMSNASRYKDMSIENIDNWTYEGTVLTVGRKYITVTCSRFIKEKFEIENDYVQVITSGSNDYKLYTSKEEVIKERETKMIYNELKNKFSNWTNPGYTLEQMKMVLEILNENKSE